MIKANDRFLPEEKLDTLQRFSGWMEVLNEAVEEGRISVTQARSLLLDIASKVNQPWA